MLRCVSVCFNRFEDNIRVIQAAIRTRLAMAQLAASKQSESKKKNCVSAHTQHWSFDTGARVDICTLQCCSLTLSAAVYHTITAAVNRHDESCAGIDTSKCSSVRMANGDKGTVQRCIIACSFFGVTHSVPTVVLLLPFGCTSTLQLGEATTPKLVLCTQRK